MMVNEDILEEYSNSVRRLKKQWLEAGMSEEEFKKLYFETLITNETTKTTQEPRFNSLKRCWILVVTVILLITLIYNYKSFYSCAACNLQDYIYPGLKFLRKLSIPIISLFPSLTAWYHETCLIQNPFFTVVDMDCWPCSTISSVREVYDPKPVSEQQNPPFYYETEQNLIDMESLKKLYLSNKDLFDNEAPKIQSGTKTYVRPNEMFLQHQSGEKDFYIWKFNNMNVAKVLRQVIPRPKVVPKFGQSTERFIIVDSSQESFQMPDTECSFSFLLSLSGTRTIKLVPADECRHQCKSLKVDLKESYLSNTFHYTLFFDLCSEYFSRYQCLYSASKVTAMVQLVVLATSNSTVKWKQNIHCAHWIILLEAEINL